MPLEEIGAGEHRVDVGLADAVELDRVGAKTRRDRRVHGIGRAEMPEQKRPIRAGARGFVLKKASLGDLVDALRAVAKGGSYLSPQVSDKLLSRIQRGDMETAAIPDTLDVLSPRELQVLRLVAEGKTSKDIAVVLNLGLQTVRSYRKTMMKKLGVNNVASLTHLAMAAGLTPQTAHTMREAAAATAE